MMEDSTCPRGELSRPSRGTLRTKNIKEFQDLNYSVGRFQTKAPHLTSEKSCTRLLLQRDALSRNRSGNPGFRAERFLNSVRHIAEGPLFTAVFDAEDSLEFAHYGLYFSRRAFSPMAMDLHDFLPEIKSCKKPGIMRRFLAVQNRSLGYVPGKTSERPSHIPFFGVPKDNSAVENLVIHRG
ncbi:hypothetical protein CSAL01_02921 [Colletotrichum salicis]|uniref:Uncharacterized protein n=1 Tax=Colletotrichum salicis TaxID=1209931 RepID=A0A135UZU4_9PEZI|nr:hypothetical protein CSAL01_02921 [Colletotrichum salicis]